MYAFSECMLPSKPQFRIMLLLAHELKRIDFNLQFGLGIYTNQRCFNSEMSKMVRAEWIEKVQPKNGRGYKNTYSLTTEGSAVVLTVLDEYIKANKK